MCYGIKTVLVHYTVSISKKCKIREAHCIFLLLCFFLSTFSKLKIMCYLTCMLLNRLNSKMEYLLINTQLCLHTTLLQSHSAMMRLKTKIIPEYETMLKLLSCIVPLEGNNFVSRKVLRNLIS